MDQQQQKNINQNKVHYNPVNTRRYLDVDPTFFERYGHHMDVKTALCAYWE